MSVENIENQAKNEPETVENNFVVSTTDAPSVDTTSKTEEPKAETDETTTTDEGVRTEKPKSEKKESRASRRISKLVSEKYALKAKIEELESKQKKAEPEDKKIKQKESPKEEDYEDYDDYLKDLAEFDNDTKPEEEEEPKEKKIEYEKNRTKETSDYEFQKSVEILTLKAEDEADKYEDYQKVVTDQNVAITRDMVVAASEIDNSVDVLYYLGKHIEESKRIADLSPKAQYTEIGKLSAFIKTGKIKPDSIEKKMTSSTKPITPVNAGGEITPSSLEKLSFSEYEKRMNEEERKNPNFW